MLLGVHVSIAGHIYEAIDRAQFLNCTAMQIFSRPPQQWRKSELNPQDIQEFKNRRAKSQIKKIFVHVPYLINLASPVDYNYNASIDAYIQDIKEAESLGAEYLVTHMGSHKLQGEDFGLPRVTDALNKIIDKTKGCSVIILLENTAGGGSNLGYKFEHQRQVLDGIENKKRMGVCFDTCHAFAAGYNLSSKDGFNAAIEKFDKIIGLSKLKLVHLNDSRDDFKSRHDRHDHIGKGKIGIAGFKLLLNDKRFEDKAFILETPKDTEEADKNNLNIVRKISKFLKE